MIDLLGASGESVARVVGVFFLGLAIGAAIGAIISRRCRRPWLVLAWAEGLIVVCCVPMLLLPQLTAWIWPTVGIEILTSPAGGWLKLGLSTMAVLPPAVGMGFFLPLAAHGLLGRGHRLAQHGNWLYASNTFGGVLGLVVISIWLLPSFGATNAMVITLSLNGLVIIGCLALHRYKGDAVGQSIGPNLVPSPSPESTTWWRPVLGFSFFSGWSLLAWEVLAIEVISLVAPISFFATSSILTCIILLLALGAWLVPHGLRRGLTPDGLLRWTLLCGGIAAALTPLWFYLLSSWVGVLEPSRHVAVFFAKTTLFSLIIGAPLFLLAGWVFPLTTALLDQKVGDTHGRRWGWLLAINGLGGVLGAETAYRFLMPTVGLYPSFALIGMCSIIAYPILSPAQSPLGKVFNGATLSGAAVVAVLIFTLYPRLPVINPHAGMSLLAMKSGREGSVAVVEGPRTGRAIVLQNQYILGSEAARIQQERQGFLPLLLHPAPEKVTFIGLATGITPAGALLHPTVETVTAVELSPLVTHFANDYFSEWSRGLFTDPRVNIVVEDGRTIIAAMDNSEDVIIGDLFLPWGPGEGRLYSLEHFQAVRRALAEGGIFCQWLPLFQLTEEQLVWIETTFAQVFPHRIRVINDFDAHSPMLGLVGIKADKWPWQEVENAWQTFASVSGRDHRSLSDPRLWPAHILDAGDPATLTNTRINTLNNMLVEVNAGRRQITRSGQAPYLNRQNWIDYLQRDYLEIIDLPEQWQNGRLRARRAVEGKTSDWER